MATDLNENSITADELRKDPLSVIDQVHKGIPVYVTAKGKPDVVIVDAAVYEKQMHLLTLARQLAEAKAEVRAGRVRPLEEFLSELKDEAKVSR